jgi:hypothetical protein
MAVLIPSIQLTANPTIGAMAKTPKCPIAKVELHTTSVLLTIKRRKNLTGFVTNLQ